MADPAQPDTRQSGDQFWYKAKVDAPVHAKVVGFGRWLRELYGPAHRRLLAFERLYEGTELRHYQQALTVLQNHGFQAAQLNVLESIIDTIVSRLSKERPTPTLDVTNGDWGTKRKAKHYRNFIIGEMQETQFDDLRVEALTDGAVYGHGFTRIDDSGDGDCVFAERVLFDEMLFDPRESKYGTPPNAFRVHRIAKDRLADIYPKQHAAILNAPASSARPTEQFDDQGPRIINLEDYTDVYEAWHPACDGDADDEDGRHAVCIEGATLLFEQWHEPRFPFAMFRYRKPRRGLWAKGLVHKLKDLQHRVNCIIRDLQMNIAATGRGFFLQSEANALPVEMLTGWQPFSIKYRGSQPPQWQAPTPFNPAQLSALEMLIEKMYDLSGASRASATSRSALGNGASGVALDTQYDIDSERFAVQQKQCANYSMDAAQLYIDASKRVARKRQARKGDKRSSAYVSNWLNRDAIDQLEYDKVALEGDQYRLRLEPTGFLPTERSGKLSAVGQLAQAGVIPQWLVAALFDEPDLEAGNRITLGAFWNAERKMDELAYEDAEMPTPAQYNDLDLELKMTKAYVNYVESEKAPDEVCQRFRDYLTMVTDAIRQRDGAVAAANPPQPAMNGPAALPGAAPMLPPGAPMPQ